MQPAFIEYYSETDYLDAERAAPVRHEYVAGEVFAMAWASKVHGTLALNAAIVLRQHLRGAPCRVWMADMKVRVRVDSAYYYPDVVVTCDATDLGPDSARIMSRRRNWCWKCCRIPPSRWIGARNCCPIAAWKAWRNTC
ncbi:MAG: Uma2 family endonuclease [Pseudomonadota bacterium]|nr:Uma2 family endonuclease [Pseudomonadota bacterium]